MTECSAGVRLVFDRYSTGIFRLHNRLNMQKQAKNVFWRIIFSRPFLFLNKEVVSTFDVLLYNLNYFC